MPQGRTLPCCWRGHLGRLPASAVLAVLAVFAVFALGGCASIQSGHQATPSHAFDAPVQTRLGQAFAAQQAAHPGQSGFRLINNGVSALLTRAAMADAAERSLDLQTYIFEADESGCFLLERVLAAAGRGVRVRLLVDDYVRGLPDRLLHFLDAHPQIEVRVFNPYPGRADWSRSLQMIFNLDQLGQRMHNKMFLVDAQVGILGGRNIGNHYFEAQSDSNFRDIDVFASGPIVRQAGANYDRYWNSAIVVPVAAFPPAEPMTALDEACPARSTAAGPQIEYAARGAEFGSRVASPAGLTWARGTTVAETPVRSTVARSLAPSSIALLHARARREVKQELLAAVAYFVPGQQGTGLLTGLAARGVRVRVLTNSLASTDVVAVHSGYARYREPLLAGGVELHEYLPESVRPAPAAHRMRLGASASTLHAKVAVYDRRLLWIGSANFDARSGRINTETGVMIDSPELAARVAQSLERDLAPTQSWKLALGWDAAHSRHQVTWSAVRGGAALTLAREPDAPLSRHLEAAFYSLIPGLEDLL